MSKSASVACRLHAYYRGKWQTMPKCPVPSVEDFSVWYTTGVAEPCRAIRSEPSRVYDYTNKGNLVAVVTDGSRVLGLGNIGAQAGLPQRMPWPASPRNGDCVPMRSCRR